MILSTKYFLFLCFCFFLSSSQVSGEAQCKDPTGFTYSGSTGPNNWYKKCERCGCPDCEDLKQSPINIETANELIIRDSATNMPVPRFKSSVLNIKEKPFNWKLDCPAGTCGSLNFSGNEYTLETVHFHHPSEHTINGEKFQLEMHFVMKAGKSEAVLATFFKQGVANVEFEKMLCAVEIGAKDVAIDLNAYTPSRNGYHVYEGSLTTPPCDEGVLWLIASRKFSVSAAQIGRYIRTTKIGKNGNCRPLQKNGERQVVGYGDIN